jgi:hypothetical protein
MHEFVEKFTNAKAMVKSRMKIYELLTMATHPGLAVLIFVMSTFMKMLGSNSGAALGGIISSSIPPSLFSAAYMMAIVSAVFMALSGGCGIRLHGEERMEGVPCSADVGADDIRPDYFRWRDNGLDTGVNLVSKHGDAIFSSLIS